MMVMNEEAMRYPRVWEVHCVKGSSIWSTSYENRSAEVAVMLNDWNGDHITHLSAPENGIIAVWLEEKEE